MLEFSKLSGKKTDVKTVMDMMEVKLGDEAKLNADKVFEYKRAKKIAARFEELGKWEVEMDDEEEKLEDHFIMAYLIEDMYGGDDKEEFLRLCELMDGMMFFSDKKGISISFMKTGIWTED